MIKIQRFHLYDLVATGVVISLFFFLLFSQPRLAKAKPKAMMSNCTGNLKQLGNAEALYEGDNAGTRPGPQPMGMGFPMISWDRPLAIQMGASLGRTGIYEPLATLTRKPPHAAAKTLATFACPKDCQYQGARLVPLVPGSFADGTADGDGICRSYVLNLGSGNLLPGKDDGIAATAAAIPIKKIESGAGTVYLIEAHGYATVFGQANIANDTTLICTPAGTVVPKDAFTNPLVPMHGVRIKPRSNALMHDGHVEVIEQAAVTANDGQIMQYHK